MAGNSFSFDFSSKAAEGSKAHFVPKSQQTNLAQFDADNEKADRLEALREQRAKDRAKRKREGKK